MPGYEILENRYLKPYKEDGIDPHDLKLGFLDFLREIRSGANDLPGLSSFLVTGLDEVLYMTKQEDRLRIAREVHNILQSAASALERKKIQVQIVCKGRIKKGETLWLDYRGERLQIDLIFGSTITDEIRGIKIYRAGFNLST